MRCNISTTHESSLGHVGEAGEPPRRQPPPLPEFQMNCLSAAQQGLWKAHFNIILVEFIVMTVLDHGNSQGGRAGWGGRRQTHTFFTCLADFKCRQSLLNLFRKEPGSASHNFRHRGDRVGVPTKMRSDRQGSLCVLAVHSLHWCTSPSLTTPEPPPQHFQTSLHHTHPPNTKICSCLPAPPAHQPANQLPCKTSHSQATTHNGT